MALADSGRDYDLDPGRFSLVSAYGLAGDSHLRVARRLVSEARSSILDLGCGRGRLAAYLPADARWVGVDGSPAQLASCAARPVVCAEVAALPFRDSTFTATAALWLLYHVADPATVLREARRVLVAGGIFVACTDARADAPELSYPRPATSFDAEEAARIVAAEFGYVEEERWQATIRLEAEADIEAFFRAMQTDPRLRKPVNPPLIVTKWGSIVWAYKQ